MAELETMSADFMAGYRQALDELSALNLELQFQARFNKLDDTQLTFRHYMIRRQMLVVIFSTLDVAGYAILFLTGAPWAWLALVFGGLVIFVVNALLGRAWTDFWRNWNQRMADLREEWDEARDKLWNVGPETEAEAEVSE